MQSGHMLHDKLCNLCGAAALERIDKQAARCLCCGALHNLDAADTRYVDGGGQAVPDKAKTRWRLINARRRLSLIAPHIDGHRTLIDIGCGSGEMLLAAKEMLLDVVGFDTNRPLIRHIRETHGLPVHEGYFDAALLAPALLGQKKIFTLSHVLEHLEHPLELVMQIQRAMSGGDLLYIEVPLYTGQSFRQHGYRWNLWAAEHRALYALQTLGFIAGQAGFAIVASGTRIFARGSHSRKTLLRLLFGHPVRFIRRWLNKLPALSMADAMIADYGFVVLRKP